MTGARHRPLGNQPSLDGLRAISVIAVVLYHAGFSWMHGGYLGVEVFFVVSGFLITSLLLDERERTDRISLGQFWLRRARRLLPALFMMLFAVALWAWIFGSAEQQSGLRRDLPWAIFYGGNWGQIFGRVPYYASADPPLLRHLWSLAVEEQWYLLWPVAFVGLLALRVDHRRRAAILGGLFVAIWAWMWWLTRAGLSTTMRIANPIAGESQAVDRTNFLYLSTFTRSGGLLLGAAVAFVWRPWRRTWRRPLPAVESLGAGALTLLVLIFGVAQLTSTYMFGWLLPVVSVLSVVVVAAAVHPAATGVRAILSWKPLVEIGRRSYGLYLWHWPIFVVAEVHGASVVHVVLALVVTAVISEACYRYVETPIRRGAIGRQIVAWRAAAPTGSPTRSSSAATARAARAGNESSGLGAARSAPAWADAARRVPAVTMACVALPVILLVAMIGHYSGVEHFDRAAGGDDVTFDPDALATSTVAGVPGTAAPSGLPAASGPEGSAAGSASGATATTSAAATANAVTANAAPLPRRLTIVGDSTAHSLAINLPSGIDATFTVSDGSVEGCGVWDEGRGVSAEGFSRAYSGCAGWAEKWGASARASDAQLALVVIGAWDVLDVVTPTGTLTFGSAAYDAAFLANLQQGIDALAAAGTHAALLEVPCMRPQDVKGAATPPLPERGDDARVQHLSALLRQAAAANSSTATYVPGPAAWCEDPVISSDLGYRWDGVHVYKPGANLIYSTIAPTLLAIPVPA